MLSKRRRRHWLMLIPLAVVGAALESLVAVVTYALLTLLSDPSGALPVPAAVVDWIPGQTSDNNIRTFIVLVAVCFITKNLFVLGVELARNWVVQRSVAELSQRMLEGYLNGPYILHLSRNSADLIHNVTGAVDTAFSPVLAAVVQVVTESLIAIGIVVVLIVASPGVTLTAIGMLVVALAPLLALSRRHVARWGARENGLRETTLRVLHQALGGIKEVKTMGLEPFFASSFASCMGSLARLRHLYYTINAMPRILIETTMIGGMLLLMAVVLTWGTATNTLLSLFGLYGYAAFRLIPSANRVSMHINQIRHGAKPVDNLYDDFQKLPPLEAEAIPSADGAIVFQDAVRFEKVSFTYPGAAGPSLKDIDLEIRRGECVGIAGATGAGKSTLVDLMLGLLEPSLGRVSVDGVDVREVLGAWHTTVGYVPQHIYLTDDSFTGNVAFGVAKAEVDLARVQRSVERAQLNDVVSALPLGLDTIIGERGTRLSGGERQRVGIARALYREPSVVIFDEATSALDNKTEREVMRALQGMRHEKTLILIAHRLSTIQSCDRLFFLDGGRVVAAGPYEQLLRESEGFRALVEAVETPR